MILYFLTIHHQCFNFATNEANFATSSSQSDASANVAAERHLPLQEDTGRIRNSTQDYLLTVADKKGSVGIMKGELPTNGPLLCRVSLTLTQNDHKFFHAISRLFFLPSGSTSSSQRLICRQNAVRSLGSIVKHQGASAPSGFRQ